jgi:hypothetical protein
MVGCVLAEMLSGLATFPSNEQSVVDTLHRVFFRAVMSGNEVEVLEALHMEHLEDKPSPNTLALILGLLDKDPVHRLDCEAALDHPAFSKNLRRRFNKGGALSEAVEHTSVSARDMLWPCLQEQWVEAFERFEGGLLDGLDDRTKELWLRLAYRAAWAFGQEPDADDWIAIFHGSMSIARKITGDFFDGNRNYEQFVLELIDFDFS